MSKISPGVTIAGFGWLAGTDFLIRLAGPPDGDLLDVPVVIFELIAGDRPNAKNPQANTTVRISVALKVR
ncbi:MAG TPA: hypothetical protein VKS98_04900 [Chthoniobacterales bacterium]|nr:hypothetical protein [Chthoniobacterales bacterium]